MPIYFDSRAFEKYLAIYASFLSAAVSTSWWYLFIGGFANETDECALDNMELRFPIWIREWYEWRPNSVLGMAVYCFCGVVLIFVAVIGVVAAIPKVVLWLVCLIPVAVICMLLALKRKSALVDRGIRLRRTGVY